MIDRILGNQSFRALAEAGDWSTLADALNESPSTRRVREADARKTWVGLQDAFGVARSTGWKATILAAIANAQASNDPSTAAMLMLFDQSLGGVGYDFGTTQTQQQLDALGQAGLLSPTDVADLKAIGVVIELATADGVESAWSSYVEGQAVLRVAARRSAIVTALSRIADRVRDGGDLPTLEAVTTEITANWPEA